VGQTAGEDFGRGSRSRLIGAGRQDPATLAFDARRDETFAGFEPGQGRFCRRKTALPRAVDPMTIRVRLGSPVAVTGKSIAIVSKPRRAATLAAATTSLAEGVSAGRMLALTKAMTPSPLRS
jgi:hypothetical protein